MTSKNKRKQAYEKAIRIIKLLGLETHKKHEDGSVTIHKPLRTNKKLDITEIVEIILDE